MRQHNLSRRMTLVQYEPAWHPQNRITMSGDMTLVLHGLVNSVFGPELSAEWKDECLNLETCRIRCMEISSRALESICVGNQLCASSVEAERDRVLAHLSQPPSSSIDGNVFGSTIDSGGSLRYMCRNELARPW